MTGNNVPSPDERERAQQALDMRLAGVTWARIAERLLYADESGARHAATRLLDRTDFALASEYRDTEGARLERLLVAVWPAAARGDLAAVESARKLIESRVRLYGLARPVKVEVSKSLSDEEFTATAMRLMREIEEGQPPAIAPAEPEADAWTGAPGD